MHVWVCACACVHICAYLRNANLCEGQQLLRRDELIMYILPEIRSKSERKQKPQNTICERKNDWIESDCMMWSVTANSAVNGTWSLQS